MTLSATTLRALTTSVYVFSACLVVGFIALVVVLSLDSSYEPSQSLASSLPDVLILLAFVLVGLVVTLKRPENLVGWALLLAGLGLLLGGVLGAYAELALLAKPEADLPAGPAAGSISRGSWAPLMAGVFLLLIVFPSGALPSRALRRFAALVLLGFALIWAILSTVPGELEPPLENFDNPLAFTSSSTYVVAVFPIIFACLGSIVVAAVIVVRRFRRSRGQERLQFKWVTASAGLLIVTLPIGAAFNWTRVAGAIMTIQLIALPVSSASRCSATGSTRSTSSSAGRSSTARCPRCWRACISRSCWACKRCSRRSRAGRTSRLPARRSSSRLCSSRCAGECSGSSTGASTGVAMTRSARSTDSVSGSASTSTSRCSPMICAVSCRRRCSRPCLGLAAGGSEVRRRLAWVLFGIALALAPLGIVLGVIGGSRGLDLPADRGSQLLTEVIAGVAAMLFAGVGLLIARMAARQPDRVDLPRLGRDARNRPGRDADTRISPSTAARRGSERTGRPGSQAGSSFPSSWLRASSHSSSPTVERFQDDGDTCSGSASCSWRTWRSAPRSTRASSAYILPSTIPPGIARIGDHLILDETWALPSAHVQPLARLDRRALRSRPRNRATSN